jgi:glycosyltransferase involved in cell wall biosynthesis
VTKVSVVIPTHNRATFLRDALQSVWDQTYQDFELIVVDDGSDDETPQVVAGCGDRLRYLSQEHRGVSAARNAGLAAATAPYLAFLDSDDIWAPEMLATSMDYMGTHPACSLVCSDFAVGESKDGSAPVNWKSGLGVRRARRLAQAAGFPELLDGNFVSLCSTVLRTSAAREVGGFDESLLYMEDWDLALRLAARHPIGFINRILAYARRHGENLSDDRTAMEWAATQVFQKIESDPEIARRWYRVFRQKRAAAYCRMGRLVFYEVGARQARRFLWESLRQRWWHNRAWRYLLLSFMPDSGIEIVRSYHSRRQERIRRMASAGAQSETSESHPSRPGRDKRHGDVPSERPE